MEVELVFFVLIGGNLFFLLALSSSRVSIQIRKEHNIVPKHNVELSDHHQRGLYSSIYVIPEYKLIFFAFPKVACSEWKRMFMRMNDNPKWCKTRGYNVHAPENNKIMTLNDFDASSAATMMSSPSWTRAAIFREPKERVLSAFLDKAVRNHDYYEANCCHKLPNKNLERQCKFNRQNFK